MATLGLGLSLVLAACDAVDPGPNFVVPDEHFNEDYFYCHVEPELLFAKKCGSGDPAAGDGAEDIRREADAAWTQAQDFVARLQAEVEG